MATKKIVNETTSKRVATIASGLLRNPATPKAVKTVSASVLGQTGVRTVAKKSR